MTTLLDMPVFTEDERDVLRPREVQSIAEWAPEHIRVTDGPLVGEQGASVPWSTQTFPLQQAIIEAIDDHRWAKILLMTAPQAFGKTQCAAIPPLLHGIEHRRVPVVYVAANQDLANAQYKDKFRPAIEADEDLAELIHDNPDLGGNRLHREFRNGTVMHVVGSESVGNLSGKTAPVIVCDDVQAYGTLPKFGHPADYASTRTGAFPAELCTLIYCGTAGTIDCWLWRMLKRSAFFVPFLPCPGCGTYQLLEFDRLVYDANDPEAAKADTWLRCANAECEHEIRFEELPEMLSEHRWVSMPAEARWITRPEAGGVTIDPETADVYPHTHRNTNVAGFWCNALYWPWGRTWGEHAAELISRTGDPDMMQDHQQNFRVVPYEEPKTDEDALEPEDVKAHAVAVHRWKTIPGTAGVHEGEGVVIVTADVMAGFVWYLVMAWRRETGSCWVVEVGKFGGKLDPGQFTSKGAKVKAWKSRAAMALENLWIKDKAGWPIVTEHGELKGKSRSADLALIDCGFLRETVQTACRRFNAGRHVGKWLPVEGSQARARTRTPVWPGLNRPTLERKTKRRYWEINTNRAKLYVRDILAIPPGEPGSLVLPADMPEFPREAFAKHICAEEFDAERGVWKKTSGENHLLDDLAEQVAGAMALKVRLPSVAPEVAVRPPPRRRISPVTMPDGRPFFVGDR